MVKKGKKPRPIKEAYKPPPKPDIRPEKPTSPPPPKKEK